MALYESTNVFNFNGYKNSNFLDCTVIFKWFLTTHKIWVSLYFTDSKLSMSCVACSGGRTMAIKNSPIGQWGRHPIGILADGSPLEELSGVLHCHSLDVFIWPKFTAL